MRDLIQQRLEKYARDTVLDEERALREIFQEVILYALQHAGLFEHAAFQGGTALRILYGLNRFSEDLDFALQNPNEKFGFDEYLEDARAILGSFGLDFELQPRADTPNAVKNRFLKRDSLGGLLQLQHRHDPRKKIKIKVELDTRPPAGASYDRKYLDFPLDYPLTAFDPPSLFAGKMHALLARAPAKGRDWYDFAWYVAQEIPLNAELLTHALAQLGPWKGQNVQVTLPWLREALEKRICALDWAALTRDVRPLLAAREQAQLTHWGAELFQDKSSRVTLRPNRA